MGKNWALFSLESEVPSARGIFPCSLWNCLHEWYFEKAERNSSGLPDCSLSSAAVPWKPSQPDCLLDAVHVGLLREGSFPLLYLAKTALLWVASGLSLEQRKYYNTCQEVNFIFKSCFLQNWIYLWPSPVTADPHMGIGVGWVTWVSWSNRYGLKDYSQGAPLPFESPYKLSGSFLRLLFLSVSTTVL